MNKKQTSCQSENSDETLSAAVDSLAGHKALVIYFSRGGENYMVGNVEKGNTAFLAEYISEMTGSPIYRINSKEDYDAKTYEDMLRIVREDNENGNMPAYTTNLTVKDLEGIDVVFIGSPIWWGTFPRLFLSFFKDYNLNGKILIPFTTNQGSGLGHTVEDLKEIYPEAFVLEGFSMLGTEARKPEARQSVAEWLSSFSYGSGKAGDKMNDNNEADGTTGATPMIKGLTAAGKKLDDTVCETVNVKHQDGSIDKISLVVSGAVDMDGTLWSAVNLGADKPWDVGNHYAWGETEPKESYTEENYKYLDKNIGSDIAGTWYDAATKMYGGSWRTPTATEWHKLLFGSTLERVEINGVAGYTVKAKNGNIIFFPGNGYIYDTEVGTPEEGFYWTSDCVNFSNAQVSYLPDNSWGMSNYGRYIGIGIRPIK